MEAFMEAKTCFFKKLLVMHVQLQYLLSVGLGKEMSESETGHHLQVVQLCLQ